MGRICLWHVAHVANASHPFKLEQRGANRVVSGEDMGMGAFLAREVLELGGADRFNPGDGVGSGEPDSKRRDEERSDRLEKEKKKKSNKGVREKKKDELVRISPRVL